MNIQPDHVNLFVKRPPKISVSGYCCMVKGRKAIRVFNKFKNFKKKPYWDNHFWTEGYCVDTVRLNSEMIKKYVKYKKTFNPYPPVGARQTHPLLGVDYLFRLLNVSRLQIPLPSMVSAKAAPVNANAYAKCGTSFRMIKPGTIIVIIPIRATKKAFNRANRPKININAIAIWSQPATFKTFSHQKT